MKHVQVQGALEVNRKLEEARWGMWCNFIFDIDRRS